MAKKFSYKTAVDELEEIVNQIESNEIDVDELADKVKRASELLKLCKTKLHKTEKEVEDVIKEMNKE